MKMGNSNGGRMTCEAFGLILAVRSGNKSVVQALLQKEENISSINSPDDHGQTPLYHACACGLVEMAQLLIEHGADVNAKDEGGSTPLFQCCPANQSLLRLLLENGADANASSRAYYGCTVLLMLAQSSSYLESAKILIAFGANVNAADVKGMTALHHACRLGLVEVAQMLIDHGADVHARDENGYIPMFKCDARHCDLLRLLLEYGTDVNTKASDGFTLLMLTKYLETAKLLIKNGADVNATDETGWTALSMACHGGHMEVAKLLVENGANVDVIHKQYPQLVSELLK